uniref:Gag-pol polyprotein n=1 Tax=Solanum tuberosum TaxID=4113 RepID=M1DVL2_SOLTU
MCARHIWSNWHVQWKGEERRKQFWRCSKSTFEVKFREEVHAMTKLVFPLSRELLNPLSSHSPHSSAHLFGDSQMETTAGVDVEMIIDSSPVVSIPQKKGKSTHLHTPPRKKKRTTLIDSNPTDGNNGRETSQIWDHFAKFIAK